MLKVESRWMIKELYLQGMSISDMAHMTGHDRKTVRAVLDEPLCPPPQKRKANA